jgi:hypothetical protein
MWIMVEVMGYQLVIYVILLSGQELLNYLYRRLSIAKMCFILYIMNNVFLSEHSSQWPKEYSRGWLMINNCPTLMAGPVNIVLILILKVLKF